MGLVATMPPPTPSQKKSLLPVIPSIKTKKFANKKK
jgi:hypothetical protein